MSLWFSTGTCILSTSSEPGTAGLPFAFGYLDDILIYSLDPQIRLDHLRQFFRDLGRQT